jgi:flagellar export protein FliJ
LLSRARSGEDDAKQKCSDLEDAREHNVQRVASIQGATPTVGQLQNLRFLVERLNDQIEQAYDDVDAAAQNVNKCMADFTHAFQERKVLDRLRTRAHDGWVSDENKADRAADGWHRPEWLRPLRGHRAEPRKGNGMKRIVIGSLVGLLIGGLGATAGIIFAGADGLPLVPVASVVGDSLTAAPFDSTAAHPDSLVSARDTVLPDSVTRHALQEATRADSLDLVMAAARDSAEATVKDAPLETQAKPAPEPGLDPDRLARLLATMPARDAARVLEKMDDAEIQTILTLLRDRQAAAILGNLPPQRVASIGQSVLRTDRSVQ